MADAWKTLLGRNLGFVQGRRTRNSMKERDRICAWTNGIASSPYGAIELHPSYFEEALPTGLALVMVIKEQNLDVLCVPSIIVVHREAQIPSSARSFNGFRAAGTNGCLDLSLTWPRWRLISSSIGCKFVCFCCSTGEK